MKIEGTTDSSTLSGPDGPPGRGRTWIPWMLAALLAGLVLRGIAWAMLHRAFFCGLPSFGDAIHRNRLVGLLTGGFPESGLPWGSPLYPYILAFLSTVTGSESSRLLLAQGVIGLATIPLVAWACAPLLSRRGRWIAALFYALHPLGAYFEMRLQPVALLIPLLLVVLRLLLWQPRADRASRVIGGLLMGLGFLLAPLLFFAVASGAIWFDLRAAATREPRARVPWTRALVPAAAFLILPVLLCAYHSRVAGGGPTWNWSDAHAFHRTLASETRGAARALDPPVWEDPDAARSSANEALGRALGEWELAGFYRDRALQILVENPLRFVGSLLWRASLLLSRSEIPDPVSARDVLSTSARPLAWGLHLFPLYAALAALGLWGLRRHPAFAGLLTALGAIAAANLLGTFSSASRWIFVAALLPATAAGAQALGALLRRVSRARAGDGPRVSAERRPSRGAFIAAGLIFIVSIVDLPRFLACYEEPSEDLRRRAQLAMGLQDSRAATGFLRRAVRENSSNAWAHADLAAAYVREELLEAAREEYAAALAIDAGHAPAALGLAGLLRQDGLYAEAESLVVRLVERHPRHPLYLNEYGVLKMHQGQFAQARYLFQQTLSLAPEYQIAQINLRTVDEAERKAPELAFPPEMVPAPDSPLLQLGQAALIAAGRGDAAAADSLTRLAVERFPEMPLAAYLRGAYLHSSGSHEQAAEILQRVTRAAPGRALTTEMAARALLAAGRRAEAEALARWNLERATDDRNRAAIENLLSAIVDGRLVSP